jgi:hypothetical protein
LHKLTCGQGFTENSEPQPNYVYNVLSCLEKSVLCLHPRYEPNIYPPRIEKAYDQAHAHANAIVIIAAYVRVIAQVFFTRSPDKILCLGSELSGKDILEAPVCNVWRASMSASTGKYTLVVGGQHMKKYFYTRKSSISLPGR